MTDVPVQNVVPLANVTAQAGQTVFGYPFLIFAANQLQVLRTPAAGGAAVPLVQGVDYTVASGIGADGGGTIVLDATAFPSGATVNDIFTLQRVVPIERLSDIPFRGSFNARTANTEFDTTYLILQELARDIGRTLTLPAADPLVSVELPLVRANLFLAFDGSGVPIASAGTPGTVPVSSFMETLLDDADASAGRTTLGVPAESAVDLQGKKAIFVPVSAMQPTVSNGCSALALVETTAGRPDLQVRDYDTAADEHAQFGIAMPPSWDEGTVTWRAVWSHAGGQTGGLDGVAWFLQGVAVSDDETADVAYGTPVVVTDDQATAEDVYFTAESTAVTIAGTPAAGDFVFFRVGRDVSDAADDLDIDARLIGIVLFITTDAGNDA